MYAALFIVSYYPPLPTFFHSYTLKNIRMKLINIFLKRGFSSVNLSIVLDKYNL